MLSNTGSSNPSQYGNGPINFHNQPLLAAGYMKGQQARAAQNQAQQELTIKQQQANQEGKVYIKQAAASVYTYLATISQDPAKIEALRVRGKLPDFQRAMSAYAQTMADGDESHIDGIDLLDLYSATGTPPPDTSKPPVLPPDIQRMTELHMPGSTPNTQTPLPGDPTKLNMPPSFSSRQPTLVPGDPTELTMPPSIGGLGSSPPQYPHNPFPTYPNTPPAGYDAQAAMPDALASSLYKQTLGSPEMVPDSVLTGINYTQPDVNARTLPHMAVGGVVTPAGTIGPGGYQALAQVLPHLNDPPGYSAQAAMPDSLAQQLMGATINSNEMAPGGVGPAPSTTPPTPKSPTPASTDAGTTNGPGSNPPSVPANIGSVPTGPPVIGGPGGPGEAPVTADPNNPLNRPLVDVAVSLHNVLTNLPSIPLQELQDMEHEMLRNIINDPNLVTAKQGLSYSQDPSNNYRSGELDAVNERYNAALSNAVKNASVVLDARMKPYLTEQALQKTNADIAKVAAEALGGSEGVAGAVGSVTTAALAPGKASAENIASLETAANQAALAEKTAQDAYQVAPNAESTRALQTAQATNAQAQARLAQARSQAAIQDSQTKYNTLLHSIDMDALTKSDPLTANLLKNVIHPRMIRTANGQMIGGAIRGTAGGALLGGGLGAIAGFFLAGGVPGAIAGGALGSEVGGSIGLGISGREATRSANSDRDQVFDPAIGFTLLMDPRFHNTMANMFYGYRGSPGSVDGTLPPMTKGNDAITGSRLAMQGGAWIAQKQKSLTGADLAEFNGDLRAFRIWSQGMNAAIAQAKAGAGGSTAPPGFAQRVWDYMSRPAGGGPLYGPPISPEEAQRRAGGSTAPPTDTVPNF